MGFTFMGWPETPNECCVSDVCKQAMVCRHVYHNNFIRQYYVLTACFTALKFSIVFQGAKFRSRNLDPWICP